MKPIRWLLAGLSLLLLLAAILVVTAPADLAYRWYADRLGPLRAEGLSGSVWDGRASAVSVFGTALGPAEWRLDAWATLRGAAHGDREGGCRRWAACGARGNQGAAGADRSRQQS